MADKMNAKEKVALRRVQAVLIKVSSGVNVFFNVAQYKKLGLVKGRDVYDTDTSGKKVVVGTKYSLTEKGDRVINSII